MIIKGHAIVMHKITHAYSKMSSIGILLKYIHAHMGTCNTCVTGFHTKVTCYLLLLKEENFNHWKIIIWQKFKKEEIYPMVLDS